MSCKPICRPCVDNPGLDHSKPIPFLSPDPAIVGTIQGVLTSLFLLGRPSSLSSGDWQQLLCSITVQLYNITAYQLSNAVRREQHYCTIVQRYCNIVQDCCSTVHHYCITLLHNCTLCIITSLL